MRLQHVYEVDPDRMGQQFSQQNMPTWDTLRIVESRNEHLRLDGTSTSPTRRWSPGSSPRWSLRTWPVSGEAYPAPPSAPARHPTPILPY